MKILVKYLTFILIILYSDCLKCQKKFFIEITIPSHIKASQLGIEYDNGKKVIKPVFDLKNKKIIVTDNFYSKYTTLILTYHDTVNHSFNKRFFIAEKPAKLELLYNEADSSAKNPLLNYKSVNVIEINNTRSARKYSFYTKNELKDMESFLSENWEKMKYDDSLRILYDIKSKNLYYKTLEFIKMHGNLYYSFWLFKTEIVPQLIYTPSDSLLEIFNNNFPYKIKMSFEGQEVYKLLSGRAYSKNGYNAPDFKSKDFLGNEVELDKFMGKYVILNFWASWCVPCIHHILMLQEISKKIDPDVLQIISISYDKDLVKCKEMIIKLKMNWINIISDEQVIRIYGEKPIPGLYLIDRNGKIIANNYEDGDEQFFEILNRVFLVQYPTYD